MPPAYPHSSFNSSLTHGDSLDCSAIRDTALSGASLSFQDGAAEFDVLRSHGRAFAAGGSCLGRHHTPRSTRPQTNRDTSRVKPSATRKEMAQMARNLSSQPKAKCKTTIWAAFITGGAWSR